MASCAMTPTSAATTSVNLMLIKHHTFPKQPDPRVRKPQPPFYTQINSKQSPAALLGIPHRQWEG